MSSKITIDQVEYESRKEIKRAVRDFGQVEVTTDSAQITIRGPRERLQDVSESLIARELSARSYGQPALADADASVRSRLRQAL